MESKNLEPILSDDVCAHLAPFGEMGLLTLAYDPAADVLQFDDAFCVKFGVKPLWTNVPGCFEAMLDPEDREAARLAFRSVCEGAETSVMIVRLEEVKACLKITLRTARRDEKGDPSLIVGCIDDIGEAIADFGLGHRIKSVVADMDDGTSEYVSARARITSTLAGMYYAIYHIWLEDRTYTCFREELPGIIGAIGGRGEFVPAWDTYIEGYIEEEDRPGVREFADIETLPARLLHSDSITHEYRRLNVGWTRGQFVVAERDAEGNPTHLLYTVLDISEERKRKERERRDLHAATHDALSNALNREAFDRAIASGRDAGQPVGFLLLDIDNFKDINDNYGHDYGDTVIVTVANELTASFREHDSIYRLGGDEFAVVLSDCAPQVWKSLCRKLRHIHINLDVIAGVNVTATLSCGVCFGDDGLEAWMYEAADQGLYATKRSGRAGCTLVGRDGQTIDYWRDTEAACIAPVALTGTNTGTGRLEIDLADTSRSRLLCGKALRSIYGLPSDASPEECYQLWRAGVDPDYVETLLLATEEMADRGNIECSFLWHHPDGDSFLVRAIGSGKVENGVEVIYGVHRSMKGAKVIERDEDARLILEAQAAINFCTIYVDVRTGRIIDFSGEDEQRLRGLEGMDAPQLFSRYLEGDVAEKDREALAAFVDISTVDERIGDSGFVDCEYESTSSKGWCRARWYPVRRDEKGDLERALFCIATIDAAMQEKIRREHEVADLMRLHYDAVETIIGSRVLGIVLINSSSKRSHSWLIAENCLELDDRSYEQCVEDAGAFVAEGERAAYEDALGADRVIAEVSRHGTYVVPATFRHEDGTTQYVKHHFRTYRFIPTCVICVLEDVTATHQPEGHSIDDLFDNAPGGLAATDWDGCDFEIVNISAKCNETFGWRPNYDRNGVARPDFMRIHEADRAAYVTEFVALANRDREMHRTCRMWNNRLGRYAWIKMDATAIPAEGGHTMIYSSYTDVTELMETRQELTKATDTLKSALAATSQLFYEYDPILHVATCFTEENAFGLPRRIDGYPESLRDYDCFHPDDEHVFYESIAKVEAGDQMAQCDMRIKGVDGEYRWYSCMFNRRFDERLGRDLIVLLVVDVTLRVLASQAANQRAETILETNLDVFAVSNIDLTNDRVTCTRIRDAQVEPFIESSSHDDAIAVSAARFASPHDGELFAREFGREALLGAWEADTTKLTHEGLVRLDAGRTEWVETTAELFSNPLTNNVVAVMYSAVASAKHFSRLLMRGWLEADYPCTAVLVDGGREFFLYDRRLDSFCSHHRDFWSKLEDGLAGSVGRAEAHRLATAIQPESVLAAVRAGGQPEYPVDVADSVTGVASRHVLRFTLADSDHDVIVCTLRTVFDEGMLKNLLAEARHDPVTGLYNRRALFDRCAQLLVEHPDDPLMLFELNVRRFRLYNSFFGEEAGDDLLRTIARGVVELCSEYPYSAYGRVESDVFCALIPTDESKLARHVAFIAGEFSSYCDNFLLEPSIGIYDVEDRSLPIEAMLARATTAAKEGASGEADFVHRYDEDMSHRLAAEMDLTKVMQPALDQGQFVPYLQPKFNIATGRVEGAEALVRWVSPDRGIVPPSEFIPLFESNGFIAKLDRHIWEAVCQTLRRWIDEGLPVSPISVNVSRVSACDPQTAPFIEGLVARYGLDPSLLELELTESAYIDDPVRMRQQLAEMREKGFKILIDDFGSGYSSLNTLRDLPVDVIKLDRMFLTEAIADKRGRTVVSSMVEMANRLDLPVVAEGVETREQADYLASLGCAYAQGFLYARPMPVGEYERLLRETPLDDRTKDQNRTGSRA